jgi:hypothetical protein
MRMITGVLAITAIAAGTWAADRSQRRAKEIAVSEGSFKIRAGGVFNTTVEILDTNDVASANSDYGLVEDHRDALRQLGFVAVHIETAKGETLDRPL